MNRTALAAILKVFSVVIALSCHSLSATGTQESSIRDGAAIAAIHHIGIATGNIDRSLKFYRDLMGMEVKYDGPFEGELYDNVFATTGARGRVVSLVLGEVTLELIQFERPRGKTHYPERSAWDHGINHISFLVSDVQKEYARLMAAGIRFHCPPQTQGNATATYGRDPDGNIFELLQLS